MIFESGKPWREADGDVVEAIDFLRYYATEAERLGRGLDLTTVPGETNRYTYEGRGVVGVIAPLELSPRHPHGHDRRRPRCRQRGCDEARPPVAHHRRLALARILYEAGVPAEALHCLPGRPAAGQALVEHPDVDMVAFTGGNAAGRAIARAAAEVRPGQRGLRSCSPSSAARTP